MSFKMLKSNKIITGTRLQLQLMIESYIEHHSLKKKTFLSLFSVFVKVRQQHTEKGRANNDDNVPETNWVCWVASSIN